MEQVTPVGRWDLLVHVDKLLSEPSARVEIVGEPGIGKTTIVRAAAGRTASTMRTVLLTASEAERLVGLAVAADLVRLLLDVETGLPSGVRKGLAPLANPLADDPSAVDPRIAGHALAALLDEAGKSMPLLLVVDDFQWVDEASYVLLTYALRRTRAGGVRVLVGQRPAEDRRLPDAERVELGAVNAVALRALVLSHLDRKLSIDVASALHLAVGGNPLYALETVRKTARRRHRRGRPAA